jgi:hypothetical protein
MNVDIGFMAELAVGPLHQFHIGMNLLILMRFGDSSSFRVIQADERLAARSETSKSEPVNEHSAPRATGIPLLKRTDSTAT